MDLDVKENGAKLATKSNQKRILSKSGQKPKKWYLSKRILKIFQVSGAQFQCQNAKKNASKSDFKSEAL